MKMMENTLQKMIRRFQNKEEDDKTLNSYNSYHNVLSGTIESRVESIEKRLNELSHKLQYITQYESQARLFRLEDKVNHLEKSSEDLFQKKETFSDQLADRISGVVGLREILQVEHRFSKYTWMALFLLGIGATLGFTYQTIAEYLDEPTATKIKLNVSYAYDMPPVGICPDAWMDAEKAVSQGLSLEAFSYSLGYIDTWFGMNVPNRSAAQAEFLDFYTSHKYKSLLDYFKSVSIDLKTAHNPEEFDNVTAAVQIDPDKAQYLGKYFMSHTVCATYAFKPIDRGLFTTVEASVKFEDKTMDAVAIQPGLWVQFGTPDLNLLSYPIPPIYANKLTKSKILINSRRIITMESTNGHNCAGAQKESSAACAARCQNKEYKKMIKCQYFKYSFVFRAESPLSYCNFLETLPMSNWTFDQFRTSSASAKVTERCLNQCPPKCDRILYQATLQWQQSLPDPVTLLNATLNESLPRKCFAEISLEHNAKYEGETMTLMEVGTYSFTELVNNVGGTLGLFVGATVMTFAQVIVFLIEHWLRSRNSTN